MVFTMVAGLSEMQTTRHALHVLTSKTFRTAEIIEIPNSAGNHSSPFITENSEYVVCQYPLWSVPMSNGTTDVSD